MLLGTCWLTLRRGIAEQGPHASRELEAWRGVALSRKDAGLTAKQLHERLGAKHGASLAVVKRCASAVHKQRDLFFLIVQSEMGDLYKVTVHHEEEQVTEVRVRYLHSEIHSIERIEIIQDLRLGEAPREQKA